jgi:class 3 adenylate cyclase
MGPEPGPPSQPELRVSEHDRDQAAALLATYCGDGRLTLEEFSERVELVLASRTQADLDAAMADLPRDAAPTQASRLPASGWQVVALSGSSRKGRWRPKPKFRAVAFIGGITVDLRQAEIEHPELTITAFAFMGGIDIVVPEGVEVHLSGFSFMGGKDERIAKVPVLPGSPLIKVRAFPFMGGVSVRTKRSRRSLRERLDDVAASGASVAIGAPMAPRPFMTPPPLMAPTPPMPPHPGAVHTPRPQVLDVRDALALASQIIDQFVPADGRRGRPTRSRRTAAPDGTVTIQFCDMSGFTALTEQLGDRESQRLLETYFEIVGGRVLAHGGYEVKYHGDEAMIAFGGASQAVRCAVDIQRALAEYRSGHETPIRAHIGLHTGEALRERGEFLGRTVIVASRIADAADADEILVSSVVRELTSGSESVSFGESRTVPLQGVTEPQLLYPVRWS